MYDYKDLGFIFNGRHTFRDFGLIFIPDTPLVGGASQRNEYEVSGSESSVIFEGDVRKPFKLSGALYLANDVTSVSEAGELFRRVSAWLKAGRRELILDYDPEVYYLAQVDDALSFTDKTWIEGGIPVTFTCQPAARDRAICTTRGSLSMLSGESEDFTLIMRGEKPADISVTVTNNSTYAITGLTVTLGGKQWVIEDVSVGEDWTAHIMTEPPVDAWKQSGDTKTSLLAGIVKAEKLQAVPGANTVTVKAVSAGSRIVADVEITARPIY